GWAGYYENRTVWVTWANCSGFNCKYNAAPEVSGVIGGSGWINVKPILDWLKHNKIHKGSLIFWGEESHTISFKPVRPAYMKLDTHTNQHPPTPTPQLPSSNPNTEAVVVTPTPQLRVALVNDPNGDEVEYYARVKTTTGTTMWESGWSPSRSWVLPEG